jgi:hypothetical protein
MPVTSASLQADSCYRTRGGDAVKIVAFDGSRVIYVVERAGIYPIWNKAMWRAMPKADFAKELLGEIFAR